MLDRQDVTEILICLGTAFLVLALVNGLSQLVPLKRLAPPDYVMNVRRP
ncbi:MAG TPA: hypothetical protein VH740_09950 [Vicinamibacterales bacterium]|jgi:hypothetical protein